MRRPVPGGPRAPSGGRTDGGVRGDRVPGGEDERAVGGDRHGVLDVDAPRPVHRPDVQPSRSMAIFGLPARNQGSIAMTSPGCMRGRARDPVVRDIRRLVHHPPDPVPTERGVDLVARAPDHAADGRRDVAQPVACLRRGDPAASARSAVSIWRRSSSRGVPTGIVIEESATQPSTSAAKSRLTRSRPGAAGRAAARGAPRR